MNHALATSSWMLTEEVPQPDDRLGWARRLPAPASTRGEATAPAGYIPDPALIAAFNTALWLGQPLLITGEPGCGKTEAANYLAWRLGLDHPLAEGGLDAALRYDVKSTTTGRDLFYSFDFVRRFYAAQMKEEDIDPHPFITLNALGRAILEGCSDPSARGLLLRLKDAPSGASLTVDAHAAPRRSVVLIDEIDKAPRETPNDLLVEIEKMRFHVQELNQTFQAAPEFRPIVVMTSNSERALPDAFLRRCVFHVMAFPKDEALRRIIANRIGTLDKNLSASGVQLFEKLRSMRLTRQPGTAELINFLAALKGLGLDQGTLNGRGDWVRVARSVLLKNGEDQDRLSDEDLRGLVAA